MPTVIVRPGEADRILAGHPWIYAASILRLTPPAADGALVQVKDHRQRFLGVGFYNTRSKIQVRVLAPERVEIDRDFFIGRIRAALALRQKHLPQAASFRVVNAESDFLSGLIVDKYADVLVVQISSLGMDQRKPLIVEALQGIFSPRAIVEKSEASFRKFEGMAESNGLLAGALDGPVPVEINGLQFDVDIMAGHKTGLYLDQQKTTRRSPHWPEEVKCWIASASSAASPCTAPAPAPPTSTAWTRARKPSPPPSATPSATAWRTNAALKPPTSSTG